MYQALRWATTGVGDCLNHRFPVECLPRLIHCRAGELGLRALDVMTIRLSSAKAAVFFSVLPFSLFAYGESGEYATDVAMLDPVVVTATLSSRTVNDTLSSVTVIDEKQLREQQPLELTNILQGQAGVEVIGNGSFGKNTSVYLRGNGSSSTLLLIDGVRMRSATNGGAAWHFLPPQLINRVEVVRGPRGSLYGADAVGGVVQVFTADGSNPGSWMEFGSGTFSSNRIAAGTEGGQDGTRYAFAVDRFDTAGTTVREGADDRGYDNTSVTTRLTHRFGNNAELGVFGFRAAGSSEYEGSNINDDLHTDYALQVAAVKGSLWVTEGWQTSLQISDARDDSLNFNNGNEDGEFNTRSQTANWKNSVLFGEHELVVGSEFIHDFIESDLAYNEKERENGAGYAQLFLTFGDVDIQSSVRYDDNEAFGEKTTGAIALGYQIGDAHRARASYGTAFRAPTFNDLYYPGYGNPALKPENSETAELGLRGQYQAWFWDVAVYDTEVEDLIAYAFIGGVGGPYNVNQARIRGVELTSGVQWNQWRLAAAITRQDPEDSETGKVLQRRAKESARLDVDRQLGAISVGGSVVLQGHRYNNTTNTQRLPGYGLLDLRAGWQFAKHWSTRVTMSNVLDKEYATARAFGGWDYLNAGRATFLSLRYDIR